MPIDYIFLVIFLMALITFSFRVFPFYFIEFIKHNLMVVYAGKILPAAIMLILVVFSLKNVNFSNQVYDTQEIGASLFVALIHLWKRNVFLSIVLGTFVYALLSHFGL